MAQRIMVIDDTPAILDLFHDLLSDEGYDVFVVDRPVRDAAAVERARPDLIILDLLFGAEAAGAELVTALKGRAATAAIPVLVCTGATAQLRAHEDALRAAGVTVIDKPFDVDELLALIGRTLPVVPAVEATLAASPKAGEP